MAPKMIISYIKINNITITVLRYKRNGKDRRLSTKKIDCFYSPKIRRGTFSSSIELCNSIGTFITGE